MPYATAAQRTLDDVGLTRRQRRALALMVDGKTNRQIGDEIGIKRIVNVQQILIRAKRKLKACGIEPPRRPPQPTSVHVALLSTVERGGALR